MAAFVKKNQVPETIVGDLGTSKRNILRKGGPAVFRKGDVVGALVDDGSLYKDPPALDAHDPNFDSEEELENDGYNSALASARDSIAHSKMTLTAFKKKAESLISSFFVNGDIEELLACLVELDAMEYTYEFVKRAINMSFDKTDKERELVSKLFSFGYPNIFSSNMIGKGFERLFELIDDIEVDAPNARNMLATFAARAVVDEVLPPSFLSDPVVCNLGGEVVEHARLMLSRDHGIARVERGWGPGDGRPVEELKIAVDQLLQEYLLSGDMEEASRCIQELGSTLFHHEVVKRAVVQSMDVSQEKQEQMCDLLAFLAEKQQLSQQQAGKGFDHLYHILPDLTLDTPTAAAILSEFTDRAVTDGVLQADYKPPAKDGVK